MLDPGYEQSTVQYHNGVHEHGSVFVGRRGTRTDATAERRFTGRHTAVQVGRTAVDGADTGDRAGGTGGRCGRLAAERGRGGSGPTTAATRLATAVEQQREQQQRSKIRRDDTLDNIDDGLVYDIIIALISRIQKLMFLNKLKINL